MKLALLMVIWGGMYAQDAPKPAADPITDSMRFQYSQIQQRLLAAQNLAQEAQVKAQKAQTDFAAAMDELKVQYAKLNALCGKGRQFDEGKYSCVDAPKAEPKPEAKK